MALLRHTMTRMKVSRRTAATLVAALFVLGGLVRLGVDTRRVEVSLPDAIESHAALAR